MRKGESLGGVERPAGDAWRTRLGTAAPTTGVGTLATGQCQPARIIADAYNVYWVNQEVSSLMRVPTVGGTPL